MAEINVGQISEALNNKADLDLNNTNPFADYVVEYQRPTADNNYTWYRLYKSGWVEQGGRIQTTSSTSQTINFPITMQDTNYSFQSVCDIVNNTSTYNQDAFAGTRSVSSMIVWTKNGSGAAPGTSIHFFWEVKGFAAQS